MIKFYYNMAPNPMKVALFLEESGLDYEAIPVDTRRGDQHQPGYAALNPNSKVPTIQDDGVTVFDSNAILLYLAEKTGKFLPAPGLAARAELLSWLMFVATGVGPYSGQSVHFRHFAPEPKEYPVERYVFEAKRHYGIIDARLADRPFMLGETYTIVDMALWGWARMVPFVIAENAWEFLPNLKRFMDAMAERPAVQRAMALKDRHSFKTETDAEARSHLFRHIQPA
ncbi:glutathione S-transferase N-terminal domain-containing protein [Acidisoma cellulosilytica]|uniref:Glutathione S-transferase N-terminal domain-containing protein n=1 Tax=Acidisoma cellulosilyticum TaxID=2802395 RepID=A0A964E4Z6_9PROT|nr:glutathione S-transferase N-terminal domain-containing protein [Acidisoma cellulosilyticum]MCB8882001.1 glutathione S-transferase N-terminal domain-containing protein [Acidisoma cellulosilyticum]